MPQPLAPPPSWLLIVDDHPIARSGIQHYLATELEVAFTVGVAGIDGLDRALAEHGAPALAVVDFWLGEEPAAALLSHLKRRSPRVPVLVVSGEDSAELRSEVHRVGADGYVCKAEPPERLCAAAKAVMAGGRHFPPLTAHAPATKARPVAPTALGLTAQQGRVLEQLLLGQTNKQIARTLGVAESTVKEHVAATLSRLGASSRLEAIALMQGRRLVFC